MAGIYISNNREVFNRVTQNIKSEYPKQQKIDNLKGWNIAFFQKISIKNHKNIFYDGEDFIIGSGAYFYQRLFGSEALAEILKDYKAGQLPFKLVGGHFCFILFVDSCLYLVSDKTGHYSLLSANHDNTVSYSTSFTALCHSLPQLTPTKQELLEYVNVSGVFGGKTIFKEIRHLDGGFVYNLCNNQIDKYYSFEIKHSSFDNFLNYVKEYFSNFNNNDLKIGCDLSGGFDTRTVASALLSNSIDFSFLSNNRLEKKSKDLTIAKLIARKTMNKINVIDLIENSNQNLSNKDCVFFSEVSRGLDICKGVYPEILNKTKKSDIIISGWGAEILRNQYGRESKALNIAKSFSYSRLPLEKDSLGVYVNNLKDKFEKSLANYSNHYVSDGELIFYFQKGRFWSGSMLTMRNKYAYWFYPFFDGLIGSKALSLDSKGNTLQKKTINALCTKLADVPFGNIDTDSNVLTKIKKGAKLFISENNLSKIKTILKRSDGLDTSGYECLMIDSKLSSVIDFDGNYLKNINSYKNIPAFDTLSILFREFENKLLI